VVAGGVGATIVAHRELNPRSLAAGSATPAKVDHASPPAVAFPAVAYDGATQSLVMFDGAHTWTWDGTSWGRLQAGTAPSTGSPGRAGRVAFDPQSRTLILYIGGFQPACVPPGDDIARPCGPYHDPETWSWDGTEWHRLAATTPDHGVALALDPTDGRPLMLTSAADGCATVTWLWSGTAWTRSASPGPSWAVDRAEGHLVTDPVSGHLLLVEDIGEAFKEAQKSCTAESSSWQWDGSGWHHLAGSPPWPFPAQTFSLGPDPGSHQVIAFTQNAQTWTWDGSTWSQRHPAHSPGEGIGPSMEYDAAHNRLVFLTGLPGVGRGCEEPAETWTWNGSDWTQVDPGRPDCRHH
jgi:hypothetical protein